MVHILNKLQSGKSFDFRIWGFFFLIDDNLHKAIQNISRFFRNLDAKMISTDTLQQAIKASFEAKKYPHSARYLLACSGGVDSVSLGATLHSLAIPFDIAHVNYNLRGNDSEEDQRLVENLGQQWNADVHCHRVEAADWTQGESLQAEAREIRYSFFEKLLETGKYEACLLAHHQDDQAETLLMSLINGNNFFILNPMPRSRPGYLRPFLSVSTKTCRDALLEWNTPWREDASNKKNIYLRNTLRNNILPALQEINPGITQKLEEKSKQYQYQIGLLEALLLPSIEPGIRITERVHTFSWQHLPEALAAHHLPTILAFVLSKWGFHGNHVWLAAELATADSGKIYEFQGRLEKGRQLVQWIANETTDEQLSFDSLEALPVTGNCSGRKVSLELIPVPDSFVSSDNTHFLSPKTIRFPMVLRVPETGEKMIPLGMTGSKMLSDIMIDQKFRPAQKHLAIVLADQEGIIALSDFRIADRVKSVRQDENCLKLVIEAAD